MVTQTGDVAVANLNLRQAQRVSDQVWGGLTFAQYGAITLFFFGCWVLYSRHDKGRMDTSKELMRDLGGSPAPTESPETNQGSPTASEPELGVSVDTNSEQEEADDGDADS